MCNHSENAEMFPVDSEWLHIHFDYGEKNYFVYLSVIYEVCGRTCETVCDGCVTSETWQAIVKFIDEIPGVVSGLEDRSIPIKKG